MDGQGDAAGTDVEALRRDLHRRMISAIGTPLEEMERTAKAVATIAKAVDGLTEMSPRSDEGSRNEGLDAKSEQRLRDQFLARLRVLTGCRDELWRRC